MGDFNPLDFRKKKPMPLGGCEHGTQHSPLPCTDHLITASSSTVDRPVWRQVFAWLMSGIVIDGDKYVHKEGRFLGATNQCSTSSLGHQLSDAAQWIACQACTLLNKNWVCWE